MSSKYFLDVGCGFIPGRKSVNIFGTAFGVKRSEAPCTIWPKNTLYNFPIVGETWWIRSTSANDTLAGTGARTVTIDTLNDAYIQVPLVVNLNGLTPVILPTGATNLRVNGMNIIDSGSLNTNDGDLVLEKTVGGVIRAFILAGKGVSVAFTYTVPAGHSLWLANFLFNMAKLGGGDVAWKQEFRIRLPNGTSLVSSTSSIIQGAVPVTVPAGFSVPEKLGIEVRALDVSADGVDIIAQTTGILTDLTHPSVVQRLPTAWTEY